MKTTIQLLFALLIAAFIASPVAAQRPLDTGIAITQDSTAHTPKSATCAKQRHQSMSLRCRFEK